MNVRGIALLSLFLLVLFGAAALYAVPGGAPPASAGFRVHDAVGSVQYRGPDGSWQDVTPGMTLSPGTRVRTGGNASVQLAFDAKGDSFVTLRAGTMDIDTAEDGRGLALMLYTGRISANVKPPYAKDFLIRTKSALVRAQGTEFGVEYEEGADAASGVYVFQGSVSMQGVGADGRVSGQPRVLKAGEKASAAADGSLLPTSLVRLQDENRFDLRVSTEPIQTARAEEKPADEKKKEDKPPSPKRDYASPAGKSGFGFTFGAENIGGENVTVLILNPRLQIGRLGIGLYLPMYAANKASFFKPKEWYNSDEYSFDDFGDTIKDLLLKFQFIQWGQKSDPVYVKAGSIDDFVIGNGFIMDNFSNMLAFPRERRIGLQFDVRSSGWGFESMIADVHEAKIFGGRFFAPIRGLFRDSEVGISFITDYKTNLCDDLPSGGEGSSTTNIEPGLGPEPRFLTEEPGAASPKHYSTAGIYTFGIDFSRPLPSLGIFTWKIFADAAYQGYSRIEEVAPPGAPAARAGNSNILFDDDPPIELDPVEPGEGEGAGGGSGGGGGGGGGAAKTSVPLITSDDIRYGFNAGVKGRILFFDYVLAYRRLHNGFIAEYFDTFYYAERAARARNLIEGTNGNSNGLVFKTGFTFNGVGGIRLQYQYYFGEEDALPSKLGLYANIEQGLIPKFFATFQYERVDVKPKEIFSGIFDCGALVTAKVYFEAAPGANIVVTYRRFYEGGGEYKNTYGIETQFNF